MKVDVNSLSRVEIPEVKADPGFDDKGKHITGIAGFHGKFANFIGWILENIFHITVRIIGDDKKAYYLNRNSFAKWYSRVTQDPDIKAISEKAKDRTWVENAIKQLSSQNQRNLNTSSETVAELVVKPVQQKKRPIPEIARLVDGTEPIYMHGAEALFWYLLPDFSSKMGLHFGFKNSERYSDVLNKFTSLSREGRVQVRAYDFQEQIPGKQLEKDDRVKQGCFFFKNLQGEHELGIHSFLIGDFTTAGVNHNSDKQKEILEKLVGEMEKAIAQLET